MRLLHIVATPRGHESNTIRIANALIEELYLKYEDLKVSVLDLFKTDLPAVAGVNIESKYKLMTGQSLEDHQKSSWEAIEANIERFLDADIYLITAPMWNFSVPYALKYYIDAIVQPGYLFRYNEHGYPEGLVHGKKMIVVTSRGADYSPNSPLNSLDFLEPYLRAIFNFVGITDIHFINAQPMDVSVATRRTALLQSMNEVRALVAGDFWSSDASLPSIEFPVGVKPAPLNIPVEEDI
jgi:FMN-dependent NADH-azoreductase